MVDRKSGTMEENKHIRIIVKTQDQKELTFKVRLETQLVKLMTAYCEQRKLDFGTVEFLYNGKRINKKQTPSRLGMKDGDQIEAMLHQNGGGCKDF